MKHVLFVPPFLWNLETLSFAIKKVAWLLAVPISDEDGRLPEREVAKLWTKGLNDAKSTFSVLSGRAFVNKAVHRSLGSSRVAQAGLASKGLSRWRLRARKKKVPGQVLARGRTGWSRGRRRILIGRHEMRLECRLVMVGSALATPIPDEGGAFACSRRCYG